MDKLCSKCGSIFPLTSEFWPVRKRNKNGLDSTCRECCRIYMRNRRCDPELRKKDNESCRQWYLKNPKHTTKTNRILKYKLTQKDYDDLLLKQQNVCAICHRPETATIHGKTKSLAVDHCHKTNRVRGLLCSCCNTALGFLKDDLANIRKMIEYLEQMD